MKDLVYVNVGSLFLLDFVLRFMMQCSQNERAQHILAMDVQRMGYEVMQNVLGLFRQRT